MKQKQRKLAAMYVLSFGMVLAAASLLARVDGADELNGRGCSGGSSGLVYGLLSVEGTSDAVVAHSADNVFIVTNAKDIAPTPPTGCIDADYPTSSTYYGGIVGMFLSTNGTNQTRIPREVVVKGATPSIGAQYRSVERITTSGACGTTNNYWQKFKMCDPAS